MILLHSPCFLHALGTPFGWSSKLPTDALQGTRDEHSSSVPGITAFLLYGALVSLLLVGQDFAALRTAASQNLTAVGSGHSLTEAMDLLTLTLLGLIGTEHSDTSSLKWTGIFHPALLDTASSDARAVDIISHRKTTQAILYTNEYPLSTKTSYFFCIFVVLGIFWER